MTGFRINGKLMRKLRREAQEESLLLRVEAGYRPRPGWQARIACRNVNPDIFYGNGTTAADLCFCCPVRQDCLADICATEALLPVNYCVGYVAVSHSARFNYRKAHANDDLEPLPHDGRTLRSHAG